MNLFEILAYVAIGFVPTLLAMKIGWDLARRSLFSKRKEILQSKVQERS
jgi:hypothetical protein